MQVWQKFIFDCTDVLWLGTHFWKEKLQKTFFFSKYSVLKKISSVWIYKIMACHIWSYITQLTSLSDGSAFAFLKSVGSRRKRISIRKNILSDNIFDFILSPILTLDPSENQSFPKILRRFYLFSKYLWKMPSLIQKVANLWKENKKTL